MVFKNIMLKKMLYSFAFVASFIALFIYWLITSLSSDQPLINIKEITPEQIPYITKAIKKKRGKILAVVTSTNTFGNIKGSTKAGKKTGYELTELSRAYYVFTSNGFNVDIASTKGGKPSVIIDKDDMGAFDYAFLNDKNAQEKVNNSLKINDVIPDDYQAVYFVGGKGAMFDFPDNKAIKSLVQTMYESGKTIAAICHGPAALINVKLSDNSYLLANKQVSGFTNDEELFLIPDAEIVFPFLLEDKLRQQGARTALGETYLEKVSHDGNLITGQNPWSVWKTAEKIITQLGYQPVTRKKSAAEHVNDVLNNYYQNGFSMAKNQLVDLVNNPEISLDKNLLFVHSFIAAMKWEIGDSINLLRLLHLTRS